MIISRFVGSISGARLSPVIAGIQQTGVPATPTVTTSASSEAVQSMTLSGTFTGTATTSRFFQYGASSGALNSTLSITNTATSGSLTSLSDSQTVFFRAAGQNDNYTKTISGTINPNFFSTTVGIVWGENYNMVLSATTPTITIGTFTGSTPQNFSINLASVANTNYHYKIIAVNVFTRVESLINSYSEPPAIGYGSTRSQTTAATQPTPSIVWEASETSRIVNWRLYLESAANNTYRWEYSPNRVNWTDGGEMQVFGSQRWTPYLNPGTVDFQETYTYYRVKATDNYGRIKYSNVRGVAPINLKWGRFRAGFHRPGEYDSGVASNSFWLQAPGNSIFDMVTFTPAFGAFSRYRQTYVRWRLSKETAGFACSRNRRFRAYYRTGWTGDLSEELDDAQVDTFETAADFPDNSASPSQDSYWTQDTIYYGGGDVPSSVYTNSGYSNLWASNTRSLVEVFVFHDSQTLQTTTSNSSSLYYNGAT